MRFFIKIRSKHRRLLACAALVLASACGETKTVVDAGNTAANDTASDTASDGAGLVDGNGVDLAVDPAPQCEELEPSHCLLPWPPPKFQVDDPSSPTGKRLALPVAGMPLNAEGKRIDPAPWNRSDGWGVGFNVLTMWPDLDRSALAGESNIAASLADDAAIGLWEIGSTGPTRVPYFVELDADPDAKLPTDLVLFLRPAFIPKEATRYMVAFRKLRKTSVSGPGALLAASPAFAKLRDGTSAGSFLSARQAGFDAVFAALAKVGWPRGELQLAWEFTTSSDAFLHGDMLHIRNKGLAYDGGAGAKLTFDTVVEHSVAEDPYTWLEIEGSAELPDFTEKFALPSATGSAPQTAYLLHRDSKGTPLQAGTRKTPIWVRVPQSARGGQAVGLLQYGHGLMGSGGQVKADHLDRAGQDHKLITYAGNWTGMATGEFPAIAAMIFDFSNFRIIPERMHQGIFEFLSVARAMRERLAKMPALADRGINVATSRHYYTGDSQGGIYGATYIALSDEVTRAVLGVPGQNYSLLLRRSSDFIPYFLVLRAAYPSIADRAVMLSLGQVLWDQVDPVSYYRHLSVEPFAETPSHRAILASAKGDWQVALLTNEITARSNLGVALAPHYGKAVDLVAPTPYPIEGSALVNWDFGNPWPPNGPMSPNDAPGDPHGKPRGHPRYIEQMMHFFATGTVIDTCGDSVCPGP